MNQEYLKSILDYDLETGVFRWKVRASQRIAAGSEAGWDNGDYRRVSIKGKSHALHRLAWLWVHGEMPTLDIDHINGDPKDNRIANLRLATVTQNMGNARGWSHNTSGCRGVMFHKRQRKWNVTIKKDRQRFHVGCFDTVDEAREAWAIKFRELYGEFARVA